MPVNLRVLIFGIAFGMILLELLLLKQRRRSPYSWRESFASFGVMIGHRLSQPATALLTYGLYDLAWQHRLWSIPLNRWWGLVLLFLGLEFCYYWYHRASHRVNWLWATHVVHHSPEHFNLSAAYRLGWTGWLSGNHLFFLPLVLLGFAPVAIVLGLSLSLLYQFWIHTELIPKLGPLEAVFNTPSHHRVHHASNPAYIDRNYGGVLIIFDRLFGTLTVEQTQDPPVYGLTRPIRSHNPLAIALSEWQRLFYKLKRARTWSQRWQAAFGPPD
jgi:sterol desaturase/sphingolipid hydroxylase (fatty acid hydroxylase superfamily)